MLPRNPETLKAWKEANKDRLREYGRRAYHRKKAKGATPEEAARNRDYQRRWKAENKERQLALQREWYWKNRGHASAYRKRKRIEKLGPPKPRRKYTPEECRVRRVESAQRFQARRNFFYWSFKSLFRCAKCGESDPACLDFHHRDGADKEWGIGSKAKSISRDKLVKELLKCDVLCSNCHRKEHYRMRGGIACERIDPALKAAIAAEAKAVYDEYLRSRAA